MMGEAGLRSRDMVEGFTLEASDGGHKGATRKPALATGT